MDSDPMALFLSTLAITFAAFCVWLIVRIVNRRERWAMWTAVLLVLVGYPLSFGPVCWWCSRQPGSNPHAIPDLYIPIGQCALHSEWVYQASCHFAIMGMSADAQVGVPYWSDGVYL